MPPAPEGGIPYTEPYIAQLELMWGEGYLSPGGAEEVAVMFEGLDLRGREVLDIGCGLGALDLLLARDHGAARVLGVDIQRQMVARAAAAAERSGLAGRVGFQLVEAGPLPFPGAAFDVVTSREALFHVRDKAGLYAEAFRVLRPGGRLVIGNWFCGQAPFSAAMRTWLETAPVYLAMVTLDESLRALEAAGFEAVEGRDRTEWYRAFARREIEDLTGPKHARLVEILGEAGAEAWIQRMRDKAAAVAQGDLRPGYLRAKKPG
jgi:phosphoethanolamine N-methyltransferase